MHIFLQGKSGVGKSTVLRQVFTPYSPVTVGFSVQRLTENGKRVGFRAATLENGFPPPEAEYHSGMDGVFILHRKWDFTPLEKVILCVKKQIASPGAKIVLLDEIGGIELTSSVFMDALEGILIGGLVCFGVFKSRENLLHTQSQLLLNSEYQNRHSQLETRLLSDSKIITLTEKNHIQVLSYLEQAAASTACLTKLT